MRLFQTTFLLVVMAALSASAQPKAQDVYSQSIVQVFSTYQEYDPFQPWQKRTPGLKAGYGVAVSADEIITTENLVRNTTLVELRKSGSGEKITATVILSDEQANLALLRISDSSKNKGFTAIQIADTLSRTGDVSILQFDETANVQHSKAQVVQVSIKSLPMAPYPTLAFTILTDVNINGEGAAALRDGKLAGLVMSYDRGTRTGSMLPYSTLKRFIADAHQEPYKGFAAAGFIWAPLLDPAKRKYHKVDNDNNGILVVECLPGSGAALTLCKNDVILEWDGFSIDNLGFYEDPEFGRLALPYLIMGRRSPGDSVPLDIIRNGIKTNITVKLTRRIDSEALVPENVIHEREEYLVEGGFIIRELTGSYIQASGQDWQRNVDPRLVNIYLTRRFLPNNAGDRVVLLASVLPDPINIGYQHFRDEVITAVNGHAVKNLADVFKILEKDGHIQKISIQSMDVDLVLDQTMLTDSNDALAALYRIPNLRYKRPQPR